MNTRHLATLLAVAECGSVAAAARRLGLAASTVTEQLQALEREFKASLVVRNGRSMTVSAAGRAVADASRSLLAHIAELGQIAQMGMPRGNLTLGSISTAMISLLPGTIRRLTQMAPDMSLKVVPGTSEQLIQFLHGGTIDCAVIVRPPWQIPKSLSWHSLRQERLQLLSAGPLDEGGIAAHLAKTPFIRMDRQSWTGRIISRFLDDHQLRVNEIFELDGLEAIAMLVAEGLGTALVPAWTPNAIADQQKLVRTAIADANYVRHVGLLGTRGAKQELIAVLGNALSASPDESDK
ncbi:LysR family transcriptional regulator [Bradyrhizobium erythrophlei]|uniref:LysR family transcriptional regulator n=1 Tax=Bradyrhizobium erythrophlei TaxID=1437360 RepID=UPI0035EC27E4